MAEVHVRVLRLAAQTLGSVDRLAVALGVERPDLERWMNGERPPMSAFLDALDIVAGRAQDAGKGVPPKER